MKQLTDTQGVRKFNFFCLGVLEQKKVGNHWLRRIQAYNKSEAKENQCLFFCCQHKKSWKKA